MRKILLLFGIIFVVHTAFAQQKLHLVTTVDKMSEVVKKDGELKGWKIRNVSRIFKGKPETVSFLIRYYDLGKIPFYPVHGTWSTAKYPFIPIGGGWEVVFDKKWNFIELQGPYEMVSKEGNTYKMWIPTYKKGEKIPDWLKPLLKKNPVVGIKKDGTLVKLKNYIN